MIPDHISGVVPVSQMRGDDAEDMKLLEDLHQVARHFLLDFKWCFGLRSLYFGSGLGGVVAVFLAQLDPVPDQVDEWLWVIVGDLPPAYLVTDDCATPLEALRAYIDLMQDWVDLAYEGMNSEDVIPVNMQATPENAERLQARLDTLTHSILPWLEQGTPVQ